MYEPDLAGTSHKSAALKLLSRAQNRGETLRYRETLKTPKEASNKGNQSA